MGAKMFIRENNIGYGMLFVTFMCVMIIPIKMSLLFANIMIPSPLEEILSITYSILILSDGIFLSLYTYKDTTNIGLIKDV